MLLCERICQGFLSGQSFQIVLVQVASLNIQQTNCEMSVNGLLLNSSFSTALHFLFAFLPKLFWQLPRSVEERASNKLLSVPVKDRTPNIVFARRREKLFRSGPIYTSVPARETRMKSRAAHTKSEEKKQEQSNCFDQAGFSWAPSGKTPYSTYRQRAIKSLRANATIPIRRTRLLPLAKRRWYQRLN